MKIDGSKTACVADQSTLRLTPVTRRPRARLNLYFSRNIAARLAQRGETQRSMAEALGYTDGWAVRMLQGSRLPAWEDLERIAAFLGITPAVLFVDPESPAAVRGSDVAFTSSELALLAAIERQRASLDRAVRLLTALVPDLVEARDVVPAGLDQHAASA